MNAIYIPTAAQQSTTSSPQKQSVDAKNASDLLSSDKNSASKDDVNTFDGDINFFDIAFSQINSGQQPSIDVVRDVAQTQALTPPKTINNLNEFGKAFNFDPVLNLTTQQTEQAILSTLDQAGQADLVEQLIGALPADVINKGFETFVVPAGIENVDILPQALDPSQVSDEAINLFMQPVQPLQPLQGQSTIDQNLGARDALGREIIDAVVEQTGDTTLIRTDAQNAGEATTEHQAYPALIATGLTPDQMAQLSAAQSEANIEEVTDVDVTLIAVLPVAANTQPVQTGTTTQATSTDNLRAIKDKHGHLGKDAPISSSDLKALKDTIDQLAPLGGQNAANETGAKNAQQSNANPNAGQLDIAAQNSGAEIPFSALVEETGFLTPEDLTVFTKENAATSSNRDLPFIDAAAGETVTRANNNNTSGGTSAASPADIASAKAQTATETMGLVPWDSLAEMSSLDIPFEGLSLGQVLHNTAHTSPTLMHTHAAAPHQATQTIAAKLTQNATQKGDTEIQIELDPPELGRVRIQMIAESDGGLKAQLSFDKPETFLMMQRDSAQLEKALDEAGIDMGDNTLEFSLSSDNQGEGANDGAEHSAQYGDTAGEDGDDATNSQEVEIIATKMDWYTDNSGNLRLDMLA